MEKKKSKKKYIIIGIVLLILVAGYLYISSNAKKAMETLSSSYVVETKVEKADIETILTGSGTVEPKTKVEIPKNITGEVKNCYYEQGEEVKEDANLIKIEGTTIKAPIAGTLITQNVEKGDYVMQQGASSASMTGEKTTSDSLAVIADLSSMKITLEVDELDIAKVQLGMRAQVTCDAVENHTYEAEVIKIASEGQSGNGVTTYKVVLKIANPEGLKIGMNADISLVAQKKENVLRVPMEAVHKDKDQSYVYVKEETNGEQKEQKVSFTIPKSMDEVAGYKKQTVEVGMSNKDYIEITSGLQENDKVYSISSSKSLTEYMMDQAGGTHTSMGM